MKILHLCYLFLYFLSASGEQLRYEDDNRCTPDDKALIKSSWEEAVKLAAWAYKTSGGHYSGDLRRRYFQSGKRPDWIMPPRLYNRFYSASQWYPNFWFPRNEPYITVTCRDWFRPRDPTKPLKCAEKTKNPTAAYVVNDPDKGPIITFCNFFLRNGDGFMTLDDRTKWAGAHPNDARVCKSLKTRGTIMLHEFMHVRKISDPPLQDVSYKNGVLAYGPYLAEQLAKIDPFTAQDNADNYALYANALWFSDVLKYDCDVPTQALDVGDGDGASSDLVDVSEVDPSSEVPTVSASFDPAANTDVVSQVHDFRTPSGTTENLKISNRVLRILPVGDSITAGFQSTDGNGYRKALVDLLSGNAVDMVGRYTSGTMADPQEQGISGATIQQITDNIPSALQLRPNVVLLHAGTNDMNGNIDPVGAPSRLSHLIDMIFTACPDATILVAEIIGSSDLNTMSRIVDFNRAVREDVFQRAANGQQIALAPLARVLPPADYADSLHPNNKGYSDMALVWFDAIIHADSLGWIALPVPLKANSACPKLPNWIPNNEIANGAGIGKNLQDAITCVDDTLPGNNHICLCTTPDRGQYFAQPTGASCADMGYKRIVSVHFADLDGDGRKEYLHVGPKGEVTAFRNAGPADASDTLHLAKVNWIPSGVIASGVGGFREQIRFADLNGDGRADYLWVHDDGSVDAWINGGWTTKSDGTAQVTWLPQGVIASGIGMPGASIRFADINGDGRAEYLAVHSNGAVDCYLNGNAVTDDGPNAGQRNWIPQGTIASGVGATREEVVFADIDGDGRDDYLTISRTGSGAVKLWKNLEDQSYPAAGPDGAKVVWWERGSITGGDGSSGNNVELADITGDGRAEYLEVDAGTSAVRAYFNACPA